MQALLAIAQPVDGSRSTQILFGKQSFRSVCAQAELGCERTRQLRVAIASSLLAFFHSITSPGVLLARKTTSKKSDKGGPTFLSAIDESRRVGKTALLCSASARDTKV